MSNERKIPFALSLVPILVLITGIIFYVIEIQGVSWIGFGKGDAHIPLVIASVVAGFIAIFYGKFTLDDVESFAVNGIKLALGACIILLIVGMIIGGWVAGGIVPAMIYYGLSVLNPTVFLFAAAIVCIIVSVATGSSWTTAATVGIALMGVAGALGVPAGMAAGAIISGAYFGDKMSPMSDTTNLAPAIAGTKLFSHIRHMFYTTIPALVIALIAYVVMGFLVIKSDASVGFDSAKALQEILAATFGGKIGWWLLLPPLVVIVMAACKIPAIPTLLTAVLMGFICTMAQGVNFADALESLHYGNSEDAIAVVESEAYQVSLAKFTILRDVNHVVVEFDEADAEDGLYFDGVVEYDGVEYALLKTASTSQQKEFADFGGYVEALASAENLMYRGGLDSMMWTISLILVALVFGGIMEGSGMLAAIVDQIRRVAKSSGSIVIATILTGIGLNIVAGDEYMSIVLTGRMYKSSYVELGLHPRNLSRSLEDSATMTCALVPWNTGGAYMASTLGVATLAYAPFAFINLLVPVIAIIFAITGFSIMKMTPEQQKIMSASEDAIID